MFAIGSLFTVILSFEWNCVWFNQALTKSFCEKYIILHQYISNWSKQHEGLWYIWALRDRTWRNNMMAFLHPAVIAQVSKYSLVSIIDGANA